MALEDLIKRAQDVKRYMQSGVYKDDSAAEKERRRIENIKDKELEEEEERRKVWDIKIEFEEIIIKNKIKMYNILEGLVALYEMGKIVDPMTYQNMEACVDEINKSVQSDLSTVFITLSESGRPAISYAENIDEQGHFKENHFDIYLTDNNLLVLPKIENINNSEKAKDELSHLTYLCKKLDKIAKKIEKDLSDIMVKYEYVNRVTDENLSRFIQKNTEEMAKEDKKIKSVLDSLIEKTVSCSGDKKRTYPPEKKVKILTKDS